MKTKRWQSSVCLMNRQREWRGTISSTAIFKKKKSKEGHVKDKHTNRVYFPRVFMLAAKVRLKKKGITNARNSFL